MPPGLEGPDHPVCRPPPGRGSRAAVGAMDYVVLGLSAPREEWTLMPDDARPPAERARVMDQLR